MYNLSGTILATIVFVLRLFETTRDVANVIGAILRFFPPYLFGSSIVGIYYNFLIYFYFFNNN